MQRPFRQPPIPFFFLGIFLLAALGIYQDPDLHAQSTDDIDRPSVENLKTTQGGEYIITRRAKRVCDVYHTSDLERPVTTVFNLSSRSDLRPIKNSDLWLDGMPQVERGIARRLPSITDAKSKKSKWVFIQGSEGYYAHQDLTQGVAIKDGDVWLAEFNWQDGKLNNERQVTEDELFGQDWKPEIWAGNCIYFRRGKRIGLAKVSLDDGSIEEDVTLYNPQTEEATFSPDGRALVTVSSQLIKIIDLQTGERRQLPNSVFPYKSANYFGYRHFSFNHRWVSPRILVAPAASGEGIAVLNIETAKIKVIPFGKRYLRVNVSKRLVEDCVLVECEAISKPKSPSATLTYELKLVDVTAMSVTALTKSANNGKWMSKNGYLYVVKKGGLKELGTWYQQISPRKKIRLSGKAIFATQDRYLLLNKSQKILVNDGESKPKWKVVDLETEKISKLGQWDGIKYVCVVGASIELGSKSAGQSIFVSDTTVQE